VTATILRWVLILSPALVYIGNLPHMGMLPYDDYYDIIAELADERGELKRPHTWLAIKSNEHVVAIPALVYAINIWLTRGDNRALCALAIVLLIAMSVILYRWLPTGLRESDGWALLAGLTLALFVFTPRVAHSVVMGFSGVIWFSANLLSVGALTALRNQDRDSPLWRLGLPLALVGMATLAHTASLGAWPALVTLGIWLGLRSVQLAVIGLVGLASGGYTLLGYTRLPEHPGPNVIDWGLLFGWLARYLGSLFSSDALTAGCIGAVGLGSAVVLATVSARVRDTRLRRWLAPWMALQVYAATNGLGTAVFRSGFREGPDAWSRYASLPALFWCGGLSATFILGWHLSGRLSARRLPGLSARVAGALLLAALIVSMYARGSETLRALLDRAAMQPLAAVALVEGIRDDEVLRQLSSSVEAIALAEPFMRRVGHVPFDGTVKPLDDPSVDPMRMASGRPTGVMGHFDEMRALEGCAVRVAGWAYVWPGRVTEVALVDAAGAARGRVILGLPRPDVARVLGAQARSAGWAGYARLRRPDEELVAYVRLADQDRWFPLDRARPAGSAFDRCP
jgi:hypothetical protein